LAGSGQWYQDIEICYLGVRRKLNGSPTVSAVSGWPICLPVEPDSAGQIGVPHIASGAIFAFGGASIFRLAIIFRSVCCPNPVSTSHPHVSAGTCNKSTDRRKLCVYFVTV
jgi:hypothetical protein